MDEAAATEFVVRIIEFGPLAEMVGTAALGAARIAVFLAFVPIFTELALPATIRLAGALTLSLPFMPTLLAGSPVPELMAWAWVLLVAKEAALGVVLVLLIGLPFWAVDVAGDILETQRGLGNETVTDPSNLLDSQLTGRLLFLLFLLFVLASGGMLVAMEIVYESFIVFPVMTMPDLQSVARAVIDTQLVETVLHYGLLIGLPAILLLVLVDCAVALSTRFAPQMNVLQLSLALKGVIMLGILPFYAPALIGLVEPMMVEMLERFRQIAP